MIPHFLLWKKLQSKNFTTPVKDEWNSFCETPRDSEFKNHMICRVCMDPADIPVSEKIDDLSILSAIRGITNLLINDTDGYPKYICRVCLEDLRTAVMLKRKCLDSDRRFRESLPEESVYFESRTPSFVFHDFAQIIQDVRERAKRRAAKKTVKEEKEVVRTKIKEEQPEKVQRNVVKKETEKVVPEKVNKRVVKKKIQKANPAKGKKGVVKKKNEKADQDKTYTCKKCDAEFETQEQLKEHRRDQVCYFAPCPICGKVVANIARHKKIIHLRAENYACHVCGKISYTAGSARQHLVVHSDKCEFACPLCPYRGKQRAYLKLHMRVHTGEKKYLCSMCPAKFVNNSNLWKHLRTHSNMKFQCSKCNKTFRIQKSLDEHFNAAHLNIRYRCSICGRYLCTRKKLLSHELKVHKREKRKLFTEVCKVVVNEEHE